MNSIPVLIKKIRFNQKTVLRKLEVIVESVAYSPIRVLFPSK